ncbi:lactate utilization protein [Treponema socranskii]|uniref:lactate utilization protein n=1 Tax=Treponema socranskii TaxID=53419 RepID=UPI003D93D0D6
MDKAERIRNEKLGAGLIKAFSLRHFDAYYCASSSEAAEKILSLIPKTDVVSWGGSMTMEALGVIDRVKKGGWRVIDRSTAQSQEEKIEIMRRALLCDTYLTGANAISEDGEIVNVDGNGNRVAAMTFGPKSVIVACGMNKVVKTAEDAISRARNTAAPVNAQRFNIRTPCKTTGSCADCKSTDSICSYIVRTRLCKPAGRIKVVLIGEAIGF